MRLLANATPRQCLRWAIRLLYVSAPLSALVLTGWALQVHPFGLRPQLVEMVYQFGLAVSVCCVVVAALASCHLAIGQAFAAGYRAGSGAPADPAERPNLRAVE